MKICRWRENQTHTHQREEKLSLYFLCLLASYWQQFPKGSPAKCAHGQLQQSKVASRDAVMGVSQPAPWESPVPLTITCPLPCPRNPYHLHVTVSHETPPVLCVYCGKSHTPCD